MPDSSASLPESPVRRVALVTGSGRRLRQIARDPLANVGALRIHDGGRTATLHSSPHRLFENLDVSPDNVIVFERWSAA